MGEGIAARVRGLSARLVAVLAALTLSVGCGLFTLKEPYERWSISVAYREQPDGRIIARPDFFEVQGPRGEIVVSNGTGETRGFRIEGLGVATELNQRSSRRLQVSGVQDGETYTFADHLNDDGPRGKIVVRYLRRDR